VVSDFVNTLSRTADSDRAPNSARETNLCRERVSALHAVWMVLVLGPPLQLATRNPNGNHETS